MKERIQKVLANAGVASRRSIEAMVEEGRVAVNGKITKSLPILIDPEKDKVEVDGEPLKLKSKHAGARVYILMNKPRGVYSTNVAQGEQQMCIRDRLKDDHHPIVKYSAESLRIVVWLNKSLNL